MQQKPIKNKFKDPTEIGDIKNKVIDLLIHVYAFISIPLLLLSLSRFVVTGWKINYYLQIFFVAFFWAVFLYRKKINYKFKAIVTAIILITFFISGIHYFGLLSSGLVFSILFVVFSFLFLGDLYGYIALCLIAAVYFAYTVLYQSGVLMYDFDIKRMLDSLSLWVSVGLTILVSTYTIVFIVRKLEMSYKSILDKSLKNEADYRLLFDQANEGVIISTIKGVILLINENFRQMSGYTNEEISGKNLIEFLIPNELKTQPIRFRLAFERRNSSIGKKGNR
jgi:PAS domain-containing protein